MRGVVRGRATRYSWPASSMHAWNQTKEEGARALSNVYESLMF